MLRIQSLRAEVRRAGLFERCEARSWGKLAFLLSTVGLLLVAHATLPFWWSVALVPLTGFFCAISAMMGHEGSHRGLSDSAWRNDLMFNITFPLFSGVSGRYWHWKHDVQHHAHPNVAEMDPDILLWPMASTAIEHRRSGPIRQWYQRNFQGATFWPLCFMLVWSMRGSAVAFLAREVREKGVTRDWLVDASLMSAHAVAWLVLPTLFFGPWALALYAGVWTIVGIVLSLIFAPAHIGLPVVTDTKDTWRLQFETTRNLILPRWMSFFFIGLDYQLEHHLFPKIPHQRLPEVAKITRAWAAKNGVPYQEITYGAAVMDVTRFMGESWSLDPTDFYDLVEGNEVAPAPVLEEVTQAAS